MANTEEKVSQFDVEKLALIAQLRDDGKLLVDLMIRLIGEKHAYQTRFKVDRSMLDVNADTLDLFFDEAKKVLRETLEGKRELNAVV